MSTETKMIVSFLSGLIAGFLLSIVTILNRGWQ